MIYGRFVFFSVYLTVIWTMLLANDTSGSFFNLDNIPTTTVIDLIFKCFVLGVLHEFIYANSKTRKDDEEKSGKL